MELMSKKSIGINFGSDPATFAEVSKALGRVHLLRSGSLTVSEEIVRPDADTASAEEAKSGEQNKAESSLPFLQAEEVIVGLPRRCFVLRFLEFPDLHEAELNGLLAYELDRHLPFPPEEAWYSFQRLGRHQGKAQVMLVAARRAELDRYLGQVEKLGLRPTGVDVSALAVVNAFVFHQHRRRAETCSLIALNGKEAEVSVVRDGVLLSSRSVSLDQGTFDALLTELRRIAGIVPEGPGKVFVSGKTDGLFTRLKEELGIQAEEWSLAWSSADASAYGLALGGLTRLPIRVNLLPPERRRKKRERVVAVMFALLGLVAILGSTLGMSYAYRERRTLGWLERRLDEVKAESASVAKLRQEFMELINKRQILNGLLEKREQPLLILKELARLLPESVSVDEFSVRDDKVKVRGSTSTSASGLISVFERSPMFENAAFVSAISTRGRDRQGFQIQASIKSRYGSTGRGSKRTGRRGGR